MADAEQKDGENKADLLAPPGPAPKSWAYIAVGLGGALALALAAIILVRTYVLSRPLDLLPTTSALAQHLEGVLQHNLVPSKNIRRTGQELRDEPQCRWYRFSYEVDLPPQIAQEGLKKLLIDGMTERQARVTQESPLEFSLGPYPFVTVVFHGGAAEMEVSEEPSPTVAPEEPRELRLGALALLEAVRGALRQAGVADSAAIVGESVEDEDAQAVWTQTTIRVSGADATAADTLLAAVAGAVTPLGGVATKTGENSLSVLLEGHAVVDLQFGGETPAPAEMSATQLDLRERSEKLAAAVAEGLAEGGVAAESIETLPKEQRSTAEAQWVETHFQIRGGLKGSADAVLAAVLKRAGGPGVDVALDESAGPPEIHVSLEGRQVVVVELQPRSVPEAPKHAEELPVESMEGQEDTAPASPSSADTKHPKMAVILDDGGYGNGVTEDILKMDPALTLAILPHTPFGAETAERAAKLGFEIMLHMPMEAMSPNAKYPSQLNVGMDAGEIARLTTDALATVPGVTGINNHIGSKFTADAASMELFFRGIAGKPYYFIDSVTSAKSAAYAQAKAAGFRAARRDVFLDNSPEPAAIRKQFARAREVAKTQGTAIAIGHFRSHTVAVLAEELEKIKRDGITLVHASELVQ